MKLTLKKLVDLTISGIRYATRPETLAATVVSVTVLAVTVNTSGVILQNYRLEREVRTMEQKVEIAKIELATQKSKNQYYATDSYLDIAARKLLSKGAAGEKLIIVPREVALRELPELPDGSTEEPTLAQSENSNFKQWLLFLSGDLN